jgi:hypothetical protein
LARTINAGSGKTVAVTDASYFSDGFGIGKGDSIVIGSSRAIIADIDYVNNVLSLDRVVSWEKKDAVSFPFTGLAPNIGASNIQR